jgi:diacylglycerol kinase (ATP)
MSTMTIITANMLELVAVRIALLFITIMCVIGAEMFNTAIELLCDSMEEEYSLKIKHIKDVSAGAVLVTALFSIPMAFIIFLMH